MVDEIEGEEEINMRETISEIKWNERILLPWKWLEDGNNFVKLQSF